MTSPVDRAGEGEGDAAPLPPVVAPVPAPASSGPAPAQVVGSAPAAADVESMVSRAWAMFRHEPMLLVTFGYLFVSMIGLWESVWFYRRFGLPILEYMQSSDYFVAGLRRPVYALAFLWVLFTSALALWPDRWSQRNPERAERRRRHWWGRILFPLRTDWWAYGKLHPETATVLAGFLAMAVVMWSLADARAVGIQRGDGHAVRVSLAGEDAALPGDLRLMGTSSAFVFLWDRAGRRVEVVPVESVGRIEALRSTPRQAPAAPAVRRESAE